MTHAPNKEKKKNKPVIISESMASAEQKVVAQEAKIERKVHERKVRRHLKPRGGWKQRKDGEDWKKPTIARRSDLRRLRLQAATYGPRPDALVCLPLLLEWADDHLTQAEWQGANQEQKTKDIRQILYQKRYRDTAKGEEKNRRRKIKAAAERQARLQAQEEEAEGGETGGSGDERGSGALPQS